MDPGNKTERSRLLKAIEVSNRALRPFRRKRESLVRDYVGSHYGTGGPNKEVVMNLMFQTAETYAQSLAANRPRVLVTSKFPKYSWFAHHFQMAIGNLMKEIHLEDVLRQSVMDAFFSIGIVKVYNADSGLIELEGENEWLDPGKPFAENVSLDDFVYDTQATSWPKAKFALNKYRISHEKMRKDGSFESKITKEMQPTSKFTDWEGDDVSSGVRNMLKPETDPDEYEPMVDLMDVWLPHENLVVTWPVHNAEEPLRVVEWQGPETGPFHVLSFGDVPDHIMGISPAMNLKPLSDIINGLLRKQRRQAQRQKDIPFYQAGHHDDAKRIEQASDGEWTRVDNPDSVNVMKMGGVDQQNQAFGMAMTDVFDRMAGNLQAMAGLGPQADTLGQDRLIHGAVSKREANMQYRVVKFTGELCRDLGWLLWIDQVKQIPMELEIGDQTIQREWNGELREGDFLDYNFEIEPFSMQYKSPSERLNGLTTFVTQIGLPMQQQLAENGGSIDMQELVEMYSELMDLPRLKSIIKFEQNKGDRPDPAPDIPEKANHTVRETVRKNVPTGGTPQGKSHVMQQLLQGGQPNQDQMAQFGRQQA
mgnify:CR=1 FL=1